MSKKFKEIKIIIISFIFFLLIPVKTDQLLANKTFSINDLKKLITTKKCDGCNLKGIDLVNKDLSNAEIINSDLKNSNLSGSILNNVNFSGSDLTRASLKNASIRNSSFLNSILFQTDFQYTDLTNSIFDTEGLKNSNWSYSIGVKPEYDTFENLYNLGVNYYLNNEYKNAIQLFTLATQKRSESIESYLSRAIINFELERYYDCQRDLEIVEKMIENSKNFKYHNTINNLKQLISERNKKDRNKLDPIFRTIVQSYSLFKFI